MCKCSLPPSHIYDSEFTCIYNDAKEVIYRAKLQGIEARDCFNLINHLNEWKAAESTILIQGNRLKLNPSCDLEIESVDIQAACVIGEAPPTTSSDSGLPIGIIIGAAAAGGVIILLIVILMVVLCCFCCRSSNEKDRYHVNSFMYYVSLFIEYNTLF